MRVTSAIVVLVLVLASGAAGWWLGHGSSPTGSGARFRPTFSTTSESGSLP
jgi:hypothetical protein